MRVLIAEDDRVSRSLLERVLLKWGYEVAVTCDGEEAWRALQQDDAPSLVVLDWMMPGLDGLEVCRRVRGLDVPNPPYLILLTARDRTSDIVAGLEAGANDYLGKPFDKDELRARLEVGRRFTELNSKLLATQAILAEQARTDALTGIMNRRAILERLSEEMARMQRDATCLGVGMIDIDHFKRINDAHGHAAGDCVLREVVARASSATRPYDSFGRFGGEEFLTVVPACPDAEVVSVLERVRSAVCDSPVEVEGHQVRITVSIGGAMSRGESVDALIRSADDALYQAKAAGRNRVVLAGLSGSPAADTA
jgi:two-component system, cell cycle response regulator